MHRYIEFSDVKDNIFSFQRYIRSFAKIKAATLSIQNHLVFSTSHNPQFQIVRNHGDDAV